MVDNDMSDKDSQIPELLRTYVRKYHQTDNSPENEDTKIAKLMATVNSQHLQALFTKFLGHEPENILDIGCGTGNFLRGLPLSWRKVGLEYRQEAVEIARLLGDEQTQIFEGNAEDLQFESNQFHVVTSFQVLEHVRKPDLAISEMFRVTKPGGLVYGEVPNKYYPKEGHIKLIYPQLLPMWIRKPYIDHCAKINKNSVEFDYLRNIHYFTPQQLCKKLRMHATKVVHITPVRLQQRFEKVLPSQLAKILGYFGAYIAGIRFIAVKG